MKLKPSHSWNVTPSEAIEIQKQLRTQIKLCPLPKKPQFIGGADLSFNLYSPVAYAAIVVLKLDTATVIEEAHAEVGVSIEQIRSEVA